jgi:hypothetical protein
MAAAKEDVARVRAAVEENGILLEHDVALPSVTSLLAGEPVRGSWWAHPAGKRVFHALVAIEDDHVVLATRLVSGKVTLVHRSLFGDLMAVGSEEARWQTDRLPKDVRTLFDRVKRAGAVRTDRLEPIPRATKKAGALAIDLEKRLLAVGRSEHTDSGAHAKVLETWEAWAARERVKPSSSPATSRKRLEARVAKWEVDPAGLLPWLPRPVRRAR